MELFLDELNDDQRQAVKWLDGPALVLAGAGSGKTKCLTHRVVYLIQKGKISPKQIVLLTFTNKAANEMKERVNRLLGWQTKLGFSGTFHSFAAFLLRRFAPFAGRDSHYLIYDSQDKRNLIQSLIKELDFQGKIKPTEAGYYISLIKQRFLGKIDSSYFSTLKEELSSLYLSYQKHLQKSNAFDFDDLLLEAYFLLTKRKEVLRQVNQEYRYFLIDEYQDTNYIQYKLLHLLAGRTANVFVVGDFSQSIYSFRGADYQNINRFLTDYPQAKVFKLPLNYRSVPKILKAASQVISYNTTHPTLTLKAHNHGEGEIVVLAAEDEKHEALLVSRRIIELFSDGLDLGEMAILYRTHRQARLFEEILIKAKLAYHIVGGWHFFERKEVKDLLAYLRLLLNPRDEVAYRRVLKLGKRKYQRFLDWQGKIKLTMSTPRQLLEDIIEVVAYRDKYSPLVVEDKEKLENIDELLNFASEYKDLVKFFQEVSLLEASQEIDPDHRYQAKKDKINLMTIHAAKGLEFNTVFITGLEEGIFPHLLSTNLDQLEEERRLFYVALTRAKERVYLSYAGQRRFRGYNRHQVVSRFINEIPTELLDVEDFSL